MSKKLKNELKKLKTEIKRLEKIIQELLSFLISKKLLIEFNLKQMIKNQKGDK